MPEFPEMKTLLLFLFLVAQGAAVWLAVTIAAQHQQRQLRKFFRRRNPHFVTPRAAYTAPKDDL